MTTPQTEQQPHLFCVEHFSRNSDNAATFDSLQHADTLISRADQTFTECANPTCDKLVQAGSDYPYYPACCDKCYGVVHIFQNSSTMPQALRQLSQLHMNNSVVDSSWKTYRTGIRAWLRFCLCVLRDHPNFAFVKALDGSTYVKSTASPPLFRHNTEEQLMDFFTWLSLEGTVAPTSAEGYISAVKAAHLIWNGSPFEASACDFYRLSRTIRGLKKSVKSGPSELRDGLSRDDFHRWFQSSGTIPSDTSLGPFLYPSEQFKDHLANQAYSNEALMVCLWHFILRPDELIPTDNHTHFATMSMITFFSKSGFAIPLFSDYEDVGHVALDLSRHGRKNDQAGNNPALLSGADHNTEGKPFCAAWQLHRLVRHIRPVGDLDLFPLFPVSAQPCVPVETQLGMVPLELPRSITYKQLGTQVKRMMSVVFSCQVTDERLRTYTAYSPRIGGAIALHEAGADGLTIRAMGQWRSDVYRLYLRNSRMRALEWSVRVSRGYKAKI
jgi:hypothetical protein